VLGAANDGPALLEVTILFNCTPFQIYTKLRLKSHSAITTTQWITSSRGRRRRLVRLLALVLVSAISFLFVRCYDFSHCAGFLCRRSRHMLPAVLQKLRLSLGRAASHSMPTVTARWREGRAVSWRKVGEEGLWMRALCAKPLKSLARPTGLEPVLPP
jgi:hypothetical protein